KPNTLYHLLPCGFGAMRTLVLTILLFLTLLPPAAVAQSVNVGITSTWRATTSLPAYDNYSRVTEHIVGIGAAVQVMTPWHVSVEVDALHKPNATYSRDFTTMSNTTRTSETYTT